MKKRTVLVTGCSRGIGVAVTHQLLAQGHTVIGISRTRTDITHEQFHHFSADLSSLTELPDVVRKIATSHTDIDTLILNAGTGRFGALEQFSSKQIRQLIDLNLTSHILIAREFLPRIKQQNSGNMIFIGSEAALKGGKNGAVYSATKFAIRGLVQALQEECSASGVNVGLINPGMVNTSFFDELHFQPGEEQDQHLTADDVAQAVLYMLSVRPGAVVQEINLQPQKKVIRFD